MRGVRVGAGLNCNFINITDNGRAGEMKGVNKRVGSGACAFLRNLNTVVADNRNSIDRRLHGSSSGVPVHAGRRGVAGINVHVQFELHVRGCAAMNVDSLYLNTSPVKLVGVSANVHLVTRGENSVLSRSGGCDRRSPFRSDGIKKNGSVPSRIQTGVPSEAAANPELLARSNELSEVATDDCGRPGVPRYRGSDTRNELHSPVPSRGRHVTNSRELVEHLVDIGWALLVR
mmetsp:Transcript_6460/g.12818  ORF Transcript_6460/g.12818 Transcript_6460/m.12818 type:complete len:231 (+) Transcript_6460:6030-6722(+)